MHSGGFKISFFFTRKIHRPFMDLAARSFMAPFPEEWTS